MEVFSKFIRHGIKMPSPTIRTGISPSSSLYVAYCTTFVHVLSGGPSSCPVLMRITCKDISS